MVEISLIELFAAFFVCIPGLVALGWWLRGIWEYLGG